MVKSPRHILVADDDPIYSGIAQETLELAGHKVMVASDGGKAISLLAGASFDAAIIDLTMPVADGVTVIETMRSGTANSTIPVIVITGHDDAKAVERAYLAGATSFLTKPLNWLLFTPHVEFVLRSGQIENELREASATAAFMSDLKSQVMQALAQEFQSPIKTIFGFSELIQKEVYGPLTPTKYKEMVSDISKSARNLNSALLKVMNFGHTLTQNLDIKCEPIKAREAVLDAMAAVEPLAHRRDINIVSNCNVDASAVLYADHALLGQALHGVIENAVRLSPRGAQITVGAEMSPDGGLTVSVSDQGPAHSRDLLREINGQMHNAPAIASPSQSSGVSIKIAKVLAEAHKGQLTIKSGIESGNVVRLNFPQNHSPEKRELPAAPRSNRLAQISAELSQDPRLKVRLANNAALAGTTGAAHARTGGTQ